MQIYILMVRYMILNVPKDKYEIRRIAFYKARFGEVEYYDVSRESYSQTIKEFEKIFWKYVRKREILKMI